MPSRKTALKFVVAIVGALCGLSPAVQASSTVVLSVTVQPNPDQISGKWSIFEQNLYTAGSSSSGLAGIQVQIGATGGVILTFPGPIKLPTASDYDVGNTGFWASRSTFTSHADPHGTITAKAAQASTYSINPPGDVTNIYLGMGNMAETINTGDDGTGDPNMGFVTTAAIADPVLIVTGNYTNAGLGTITVSAGTSNIALLPATMPTPGLDSPNPPTVNTFNPDAIVNGTVNVPEPASGMLFLLISTGLLRRRRGR